MPPDIEHALDEIARLRRENAQLRALLVELLQVVKAVEVNLQTALDKDCE